MPDDHYDIIVIGSGPGGGALAQRLAPTGKRILMLERGEYLPRSRENWDSQDRVRRWPATRSTRPGTARTASSFKPGLHYWVGGNSKVYGAALFRLREADFGEIHHKDGLSPAWPLGYDAFEPYYTRSRDAVPRPRPARRGPERALVVRSLRLPGRSSTSPASSSSATSSSAKGCIPSTCRSASSWTRTRTAPPPPTAPASAATRSTASRARSTPRPTRRSSASTRRRRRTATSPCSPAPT